MIDDMGFTLMAKVEGTTLSRCWEQLSEDTKDRIAKQLHVYVEEWRRIEGQFYGTIDGGPCEDIVFKHPFRGEPLPYGPYKTR